jgi:hypothetical protein
MAQRRFEHFREYCQDINSHFFTTENIENTEIIT